MKRLTILFFTLSCAVNLFSQKEANYWYFGQNAALNFNSGTPVPISGSLLSTTEGCSSFSDSNGNLLFYVGAPNTAASNLTVWNKNNKPMPFCDVANGGQPLQGDASSSQSALTIPAPGKPNIYYLFTVGAPSSNNQGFWYYTIDMTKDNGNGDIIAGPIDLSENRATDWSEKITAVRAKECNTFWAISLLRSDTFYAYKVNSAGVHGTPVKSKIAGLGINDPRGYLKVSPDGKKLIAASMGSGTHLFDFDATTGIVSNARILNVSGNSYGVEFSASSKRLYISTGDFLGATENLFQFDMSLPNINDINNSRYLVHSYYNTRGALQLGPNRKIYWTSDSATSISVVNNPEVLGAGCNYAHQSVNLGGAIASQGLPPFISSLLLPTEIKDLDNDQKLNDLDLQFCSGANKSIAPNPVDPNLIQPATVVTYTWFFEDATGTTNQIHNDRVLTLTNISPVNNGKYTLAINYTNTCGDLIKQEGTFSFEVFAPATATKPLDIYYCDSDNDGLHNFDLAALKNGDILNGQDPNTFDVLFFSTKADAENNVTANSLPTPYTNPAPFSTTTIYVRVHNKKAPNACFALTEFELKVNGLPVPATPPLYRVCDDIANGGDTDGFFNAFLLNTKDTAILNGLDPTTYDVLYYTTAAAAQTRDAGLLIDKTAPYRNIVKDTQPIYVRVENKNNTNCFDASVSFNLEVAKKPVIKNNPASLRQCDDNADLITTFNLTKARINISDNYTNETFTYYATQAAAIAGTPEIADPIRYPVNTNGQVWIKTTSIHGCSRISSVNLVVGYAADLAYNKVFEACDDLLDVDGNDTPAMNDDTDGITTFDFSVATNEIKNLVPNPAIRPNLEVLFYENPQDRVAAVNEITDIANYRNKRIPNTTGTNFPIYVKIVNKTNNDCTGLATLYLKVNTTPIVNDIPDIVECDDYISGALNDGKNVNMDLRNYTVATILGPTQAVNDFEITYYHTKNDADTKNNPITNDTAYTGTHNEIIYVRVEHKTSGCFNTHKNFKILINPLPTIPNSIPKITVCDVPNAFDGDARNRLANGINLAERDVDVLNGKDPALFSVSYHTSSQDAIDGLRPLNKNNFSNDPGLTTFPADFNTDDPAIQKVYVSILNETTQCRFGFVVLDVVIYPKPNTPAIIAPYIACDNTSDANADDANGVNGDITLKNKKPAILANYTPAEHANFTVSYHTSSTDAMTGSNPLNENLYENSTNGETIYVRVLNNLTKCVSYDTSFTIQINPLPSFDVPADQVYFCLNTATRKIAVENAGAIYDYEWTNEAGQVIAAGEDLIEVPITSAGNYTVTATMKDGTNCNRTKTISVKASNIATINDANIRVIDDTDNNTIEIIDTSLLGAGNYQYLLLDADGAIVKDFQEEPLFDQLEGGIYTLVINDKNGCTPDTNFEISVIEFPKFFTPNDDGIKDTWHIKGANATFYPSSAIHIFNRFGKVVATIGIDDLGWDGRYKGKQLPPNDYWFKVQLIHRNKKKVINRTGHFSLLRN
ncbi:T9SS type B sorting domain-containing protein [Tenacibaculum maritimum]|uniref:T9SS type B sorting domain-containing protein n=1 Tax=Tenacibaculum maritimum TaxID=107401 RepID=UPI0012E588D2|nr:T9SS type B sorting domain-containing protein [Tenacibaculum maritimum]CAA0149342.1 Protein of unknown function precursor containing a C-terminal secretion signal [Tenacibaculum maritimum]